eukprot:GHVP01009712.1.p1 GENE.GHVP01009712.1~~GHVP01009712.1.p1  ORF type:complete len:182 (-),score=13.41 GHVP01009712.1:142-687(-)
MPAIMAFVVRKRHNTRFFMKEMTTARHNLPPGTVIQDNISHPIEYPNWYMITHAGIKGTSRPCRYIQIQNDFDLPGNKEKYKISSEDILHFCYQLCFLQGRCQRSVSVPTPVYYAHLFIERARILSVHHVATKTGRNMDSSDTASLISDGAGLVAERTEIISIANEYLAELSTKAQPLFYA